MKAAALVAAALAVAAMHTHPEAAAGPDPDSPEIHAKATEALSRAERRTLAGETRQVQGMSLAVKGRSENIAALLRDLNAEVRGKEVRIALNADVLFDFDKADLKAEARPALEKVVNVLKSYPQANARIEGHTDSKGDDKYNQKLSEKRAESVRRFLSEQGATLRMSSRGFGETKPVAPNAKPDGRDDPEGRQKNRRVEITVQQL